MSAVFDPEVPWGLHAQVAVRPERFGALLYHFGTRRLSFLKSPLLLTLVSSLAGHDTADDAINALGVSNASRANLLAALHTLAETGMISRRTNP